MSDPIPRTWGLYVTDMLTAARKVAQYTQSLDFESFVSDELVYDATLRNLALIGEAARQIPSDVRDRNPEIPWRMIIAARNQLIHGYLGIDDQIIWSIIHDDLPSLIEALVNLDSATG